MTYSLAGRCARTGQLGAIVTTSSIAVGSRCVFARAGVGAVLTQHRTDPTLGPLALDMLARGCDARHALAATVASTPHHGWRQLALINAHGGIAAFTGTNVIAEQAAEAHGTDCVAIANIVRSQTVPQAMVDAFSAHPGAVLAERLLAALEAGAAAGGEFKPVVAAALLIVDRTTFPYVDLRVDLDADPIGTLTRLWHAYAPETDAYVTRALDPDQATLPADVPT